MLWLHYHWLMLKRRLGAKLTMREATQLTQLIVMREARASRRLAIRAQRRVDRLR